MNSGIPYYIIYFNNRSFVEVVARYGMYLVCRFLGKLREMISNWYHILPHYPSDPEGGNNSRSVPKIHITALQPGTSYLAIYFVIKVFVSDSNITRSCTTSLLKSPLVVSLKHLSVMAWCVGQALHNQKYIKISHPVCFSKRTHYLHHIGHWALALDIHMKQWARISYTGKMKSYLLYILPYLNIPCHILI